MKPPNRPNRGKLQPVASVLLAAALLFCDGCLGSDRPATAPVRGQVTYRGKPVVGATLAFLCEGAPRHALGTTDAAGNYQLTTFEPNDGAVIGTHVVTVKIHPQAETIELDPSKGAAAFGEALEKQMQATLAARDKAAKAPPQIPPKYGSPATTDLRKEVVEGENVINIEL
jgi:hypothetical protein